jgi:glutamate carboxypeptidase
MLEVVRALDAVGVGREVGITAVLIGDEERSGKPLSISRRDLRAAAEGVDFAFGFEDGDGDPATAVISRRGAASWTLEVTGTPAHSSQVFQPAYGAGAIFEAARILNAFYEELSTVENLTFNPGNILGGTDVAYDAQQAKGSAFGKNNVIAERALVHGDLRALSPEQYEMAKERMSALLAQHLPGTSATISFDDGYPPMAPSGGNRELLSMLDAASRDLGLGPVAAVNPRNAGAADISFVADLVPSALDGLGLMGTGGHTVNEVADLDTLLAQTRRVALVIYRLVR